jgi:hypothetical protein
LEVVSGSWDELDGTITTASGFVVDPPNRTDSYSHTPAGLGVFGQVQISVSLALSPNRKATNRRIERNNVIRRRRTFDLSPKLGARLAGQSTTSGGDSHFGPARAWVRSESVGSRGNRQQLTCPSQWGRPISRRGEEKGFSSTLKGRLGEKCYSRSIGSELAGMMRTEFGESKSTSRTFLASKRSNAS